MWLNFKRQVFKKVKWNIGFFRFCVASSMQNDVNLSRGERPHAESFKSEIFSVWKRCWYKFKHANFWSKTVAHLQISSSSKEFKCYIVIFSTLKLLLDSENVSQFSFFPLLRNDMLLIFNWSFSIKYGRSVWIHRLPSNTLERKISLI